MAPSSKSTRDHSQKKKSEDMDEDWDHAYRPPRNSSAIGSKVTKFFHKRQNSDASIGSVGSFSQSEDFQTMLHLGKNDKAEPLIDDEKEEIYLVKQRYGYLSILFSIVQTIILIIMMVQCGVASMKINPMFGPYPDALSEWGGKNAVNILDDGEWWRLLTPILLHAGVIHLLCNVAVQLDTGAFFEREWGSHNWLIIYLVSAVASSVLSVIVKPDFISVGSSGAVMGLFGGKAAEVICKCCEPTNHDQARISHQVRKEQCSAVTCSIVVVGLFSFVPYVDWAAHLGGLLGGFCVGFILFAFDLRRMVMKIAWFIAGVVLTATYFIPTFQKMYSGDIDPAEELRDVCGYYKQFSEDYECNCMRNEQQEG